MILLYVWMKLNFQHKAEVMFNEPNSILQTIFVIQKNPIFPLINRTKFCEIIIGILYNNYQLTIMMYVSIMCIMYTIVSPKS